MAVISTQNASSVKVKFDKGANVNGDRVINTKTFSYIKSFFLLKYLLSEKSKPDIRYNVQQKA